MVDQQDWKDDDGEGEDKYLQASFPEEFVAR